ncbi:MAG: hypothetical protein U5K81_06305 [Trueperaceae bacterium]|nr:hypothetical protein [Trueperaceae bacterium]
MYPVRGFRPVQIGDVDVIAHDGAYHLFHLVLPNHDLIAHAISEDGLSWRRAPNALFVGDPGAFDDDMLWTMHVSRDPAGGFRMLYTGLARDEEGRVQRIGLARSDDLMHWRKVEGGGFPLALDHPAYECELEPRGWTSFRDPYLIQTEHGTEILASARVAHGPPLRRGCVARLAWDGRTAPRPKAPLHHPNRYDDVEVPSLFEDGGHWWLLGSIREDRKVHLWRAGRPDGPFEAPSDNVLLPQGNYAARISASLDGGARSLWNFFASPDGHHLMAPPKRVEAENGRLRVRSHPAFDAKVRQAVPGAELSAFTPLCGVSGTRAEGPDGAGTAVLRSPHATELFLMPEVHRDVRVRMRLAREGPGKLGLLLRVNEGGEGYHLSLSPDKGLAALRVWTARRGHVEPGAAAFDYRALQEAAYLVRPEPLELEVVAFGGYLEASLGGEVVLSLVDDTMREGRFGVYVESTAVRLRDLTVEILDGPADGGYRLRG